MDAGDKTPQCPHLSSRPYLIYSEADFEVFRPAGATRCTDGGEICHGGGDRPLLHDKFHPHRGNG